jgi:magnesium-transporting ATPase (P-type)
MHNLFGFLLVSFVWFAMGRFTRSIPAIRKYLVPPKDKKNTYYNYQYIVKICLLYGPFAVLSVLVAFVFFVSGSWLIKVVSGY